MHRMKTSLAWHTSVKAGTRSFPSVLVTFKLRRGEFGSTIVHGATEMSYETWNGQMMRHYTIETSLCENINLVLENRQGIGRRKGCLWVIDFVDSINALQTGWFHGWCESFWRYISFGLADWYTENRKITWLKMYWYLPSRCLVCMPEIKKPWNLDHNFFLLVIQLYKV